MLTSSGSKTPRPRRPSERRGRPSSTKRTLQIPLDENDEIDLNALRPSTVRKIVQKLQSKNLSKLIEAVTGDEAPELSRQAPRVTAKSEPNSSAPAAVVDDPREQTRVEQLPPVNLPAQWGKWPWVGVGWALVPLGMKATGATKEAADRVCKFAPDEQEALAPVTARLLARYVGSRMDPDWLELLTVATAIIGSKLTTLKMIVEQEAAMRRATAPAAADHPERSTVSQFPASVVPMAVDRGEAMK